MTFRGPDGWMPGDPEPWYDPAPEEGTMEHCPNCKSTDPDDARSVPWTRHYPCQHPFHSTAARVVTSDDGLAFLGRTPPSQV